MNRLLNRSLHFIPALIWSQIWSRPSLCPHPYAGNLSCADNQRTERALIEKATCVSHCRVAKSASCWPADGLNSDIIMIPSKLTVVHVRFMCEGIKMLVLRIRFFLHPFPPQKRRMGSRFGSKKAYKNCAFFCLMEVRPPWKCFSPHLEEICSFFCCWNVLLEFWPNVENMSQVEKKTVNEEKCNNRHFSRGSWKSAQPEIEQ